MKLTAADGPLTAATFPSTARVSLPDGVVSGVRVADEQSGLQLWRHTVPAGGQVRFASPLEDHVLYVRSGEARADGAAVAAGGVVCVACNASAVLDVGVEDLEVLHFVGDPGTRPSKAGGCVHVVSEPGLLTTVEEVDGRDVIRTVYADSECPTCSVWLHKSVDQPGRFYRPHKHNVVEIIAILEGAMAVGAMSLPEGSAIVVPGEAYYSFAAGPTGLTWLNFRQEVPYTQEKGADPTTWVSQRDSMHAKAGRPGVKTRSNSMSVGKSQL